MSAAPHISEPTDSASHLPSGELPHQRHSRLNALQHAVTAAANSAQSFDVALRQTLPSICSVFGWLAAHAFVMAERELILLSSEVWYFENQDGLPRLATVRAEPPSFNPAAEEIAIRSLEASDAPRAALARELGLSHIVHVTVPAGPLPGALIEFFSCNQSELDEDEREALSSIAAHLGRVLERERYVSALLRSEAKFRAIFESNAVPMYFWNSDKMILDANNALLRLIGFTREEVLRGEVCCTDITPPDQRYKDTEAIEQLRRTGYCQPYEKNWVRRDGTVLSVVLGGALLPGSNDMGTAVAVDITELRRTASTLRESERRYRLATSAAAVSIWELDLHSGVVFSDGVLSGLLGYPRDETASHAVWISRMPGIDRKRVLEHERSVLDSAERLPDGTAPIPPIEFCIFNKRGRPHWFLTRGQLLRDAFDRPYRAIGAITDITEQKRFQMALSKKQFQLREAYERVRTLTGRLIHAQEQERMRVARDIHDDLGQRLAALGISLAHIRRLSTGNEELFAQVENDVDELARAIRELSHNLHSAVLEHAGLEAAVRSLADEQSSLGHLRVTLHVEYLPRVLPSSVALTAYRIVQEGLRNVQKHSGATAARVYLNATELSLLIQIKDEGRGFNPADMNGRTGLGLISAEERTRLLGGKFWITSYPGQGTRLSAVLPLDKGDLSEAA
jgi:PAS domain S-box-containing protein